MDNDIFVEDNLYIDQNKIEFFFNVRYALVGFKLFIMIVNVSYFTGVIWLIYCQITEMAFYQH